MHYQYSIISRQSVISVLIAVGITVSVFAAYWRVLGYGFLSYDDQIYVIQNTMVEQGLTFEGVRWSFTTIRDGNWFPLTWLSYMLDVSLYGYDPRHFHAVNIACHALNSVLLFLLLQKMTSMTVRSAFVAFLFALHPLHVESVAWISERKDVLSTLFLLLTILAYYRYHASGMKKRWYGVAVALYASGLMAKPMIVTAPVLLFILDYWPLERYRDVTLTTRVFEKIPFAVLAAVSSLITYQVQSIQSVVSYAESPFSLNLKNALVSYVAYLGKMLVPVNLAVMYPFPASVSIGKAISAFSILIAVSVVLFLRRKQFPWACAGWFWFLVTLIPVIGIIRVGKQAMADRYTYIPLIGIFILVVWVIAHLSAQSGYASKTVAWLGCACIFGSAVMTWVQTGYWSDTVTLFTRAIDVTDNNWIAYGSLGYEYNNRGDIEKAQNYLEKSLKINPNYPQGLYNLGIVHNKRNEPEHAAELFRRVIMLDPSYPLAHYNLGLYFLKINDVAGAVQEYNKLMSLDEQLANALLSNIKKQ